jgi:hypothetical protein
MKDALLCLAFLIGLVIIPIFTFGYEASNAGYCQHYDGPKKCDAFESAFFGLCAGVVWPLYWSWELQRKE